ncbi:MAG: hypothetical protein JXB42_12275 [Deltaproteobacteria bacterium]|nr:hypothetical protein [Deltaproteobacteria bacterium]
MDIYNYAFQNRVPFLYLRTLFEQGCLDKLSCEYERSLKRHNNLHTDIRRLTHNLEDTRIECIFLKTLRYYPENPNDIDMIIQGGDEQYEIVIDLFERLGYRKYNTTFGGINSFWDPKRPEGDPNAGDKADYLDLDLYREISVHDLIFFDKGCFLGLTSLRTFVNIVDDSETTARVLPPWLDLFIVCLHSIFPNRSYGLELFYTTLYTVEQSSEPDLRSFVDFTRSVCLGKQIGFGLYLTQQLLKKSLNCSNDRLDYLVNKLFGTDDGVISIDSYSFPFIYPLTFFLWTGVKSALTHKKGFKSIGKVMARMLNPSYVLELSRDVFSRKLADERYKLKY